ncbi:MAG: cell division protein FtsA [Fimbriimonadaceae bacterium]|nr:cell division protein FtsA [Fimbriimonadaceae bacterium]
MNNPRVFAVDLGTTKVAALSATLNDQGHVKVEAVASVPCKGVVKGLVKDKEAVALAIDRAVGRVESEVRSRAENVFVTIGGVHVTSQLTRAYVPIVPTGRVVRRQDVHQVIGNSRQVMVAEGREVLMSTPAEFLVDGHRVPGQPVGHNAARLEVATHLVTVDRTEALAVKEVVAAGGRHVEEIVPESLAAGLGVVSQDACEAGVVVVDIGGSVTNIAVFDNGACVHLATIPVGSWHVSNDIAALLRVSFDEAERIKLAHGSAIGDHVAPDDVVQVVQEDGSSRPMQRHVLAEIVESRMKETVQLALATVGDAGMTTFPRAGVVLCGGGSLLPGTEVLFTRALDGKKVRTSHPRVAGGHTRDVGVPQMSTVVGVAKHALAGHDDEFVPVSAQSGWQETVRSLKSLFGAR